MKSLDLSLVRYLVVGGTSFICEYGTFYLLYREAAIQVYIANSLSFSIGLVVSFSLNRIWTFKAANYKLAGHHQLILYSLLAIINLCLINLIIGFLKILGISPLIGKFIAMASVVTWNFAIFKLHIFAKAPRM